MKFAVLSTLFAAATAFQAPSVGPSIRSNVAVHETKADLESLAGDLNPLVKFYDPLNLAEAEFWGATNESTIGFLRHAEIKHGRVAMFAFVGYIAHANGIKWPWAMQMDGTPFPSETNPPALWDAISDEAKWQIFLVIGFLEFWSELSTPQHKHYMSGGRPGDFPDFTYGEDGIPHPVPFNLYDPFKFNKNMSPEKSAKGLQKEINNGRLAMFGILGFLAEQTTPGSVPLLKGVVPAYSGEVMAPFSTNVIGMPFGMN
eukprot:CAMPEP_0118643636 /NCGR_PEP_ID=MMETSP0785-20121206/6498_1 /TAXON_ID=91992 /ORGANISM="Bolidomonas pacifica, Strain CCMP 1866" /LENGTH=257 /DNA_ID=CAMNT_0006535315 /DNA_START=342 /DNA_END=1115 /DNA_ORIENTATION=+